MHTFKSKIYVYGRSYQFDIFFIFFLKIKFFLVREYLYKRRCRDSPIHTYAYIIYVYCYCYY